MQQGRCCRGGPVSVRKPSARSAGCERAGSYSGRAEAFRAGQMSRSLATEGAAFLLGDLL